MVLSSKWLKNDRLFVVSTMFVSYILIILNIDQGHNWGGDFSMYISQAKAILAGDTSSLLEWSKETKTLGSQLAPALYPVGFPAIVAIFISIVGEQLCSLKLLNALFFVFSLPFLYAIFREILSNGKIALLLTIIVGVHPFFLKFSDHVLSEFPYLFFSTFSIWLILKNSQRPKWWIVLLLGFSLAFVMLIRSLGVVLFLSFLLSAVYQKRILKWDTILTVITSITVIWISHMLYINAGSGYLEDVADRLSMNNIWDNLKYYTRYTGIFFIPILQNKINFIGIQWLGYVLFIPSFFFFLKGILSILKNEKQVFLILYVLAIALVTIIWPYQQLRFILPFLPFYGLFSFKGLMGQFGAPLKKPFVRIGITLYFVVQGCIFSVNSYFDPSTNQAYDTSAREVYGWIKTHTQEEDRIIFFKPRVLRLFTQRNGINIQIIEQIKTSEAAYYLIWKSNRTATIPTDLQLVFENEAFLLYRLK